MVRASSVLEVTRSCLVGSTTDEKEKPRGGIAGPFQQRDFGGVSNSADAVFASILGVIQARNHVAALIDIGSRLDDFRGAPASARDEMRARYLACWEIYAAAFPTPVRESFPSFMGVPFKLFEDALNTVGWVLATPAARERAKRNPDAMITPGDLADE